MKSVCFFAEDEGHGQESVEHFGGVSKIEKSSCCIDGSKHLFGNIARVSKLLKGKGDNNVVAHDVQWEDLVLGETKIDCKLRCRLQTHRSGWCVGRRILVRRRREERNVVPTSSLLKIL
jgi:hypothetical protein